MHLHSVQVSENHEMMTWRLAGGLLMQRFKPSMYLQKVQAETWLRFCASVEDIGETLQTLGANSFLTHRLQAVPIAL